jgi:hypothetical protein
MKWVSKISLMAAGVAMATVPAWANPVVRMGGPDHGINPSSVQLATDGVAPLVTVLANPTDAGMDDGATVAYQVGRLNSLKAWGLSGLGGIAEITACELDVVQALSLAIDGAINCNDQMLLEGKVAQDMIASMLGLPMLGVDNLAAIDELAASGDAESVLAAMLTGQLNIADALAQLEALANADLDGTNVLGLSSGGGGGAWYGGTNWWNNNYGNNTGNNNNGGGNHNNGGGGGGGGGSGGTTSPHNVIHHASASDAAPESGNNNPSVPLPMGGFSAMIVLVALAAAKKAGLLRRRNATA